MGDGFIRFVEDGTGAKYVRFGTRCGVCDRRLGFFATGFWSTNTQQLADGPLCPVCAERVKKLIVEKQEWMSPEQKKDPKWKQYKKTNWHLMSLADAKELFTQKEANDADRLNEYADGAKALFRVWESFAIEPNALQVGIKRAKQLKEKTVVFGTVDEGCFRKGDAVRIDHNGILSKSFVLEAYAFDTPENTFEIHVKANIGKQKLQEEQIGWLILDYEGELSPRDRIIG